MRLQACVRHSIDNFSLYKQISTELLTLILKVEYHAFIVTLMLSHAALRYQEGSVVQTK